MSLNLTMRLLDNTGINKYAIELLKRKWLLYNPICALSLVKVGTLKTYIKNNHKKNFIWFFEPPANTPIIFDKKPDGNLCLYVNYWGFYNLTINNWYFLLLISETLNLFGQAKYFINIVSWVLEWLQKYGLYTNLKKCWFHKNEVQFLGFIVLAKAIRMEEEWIKTKNNKPKPKSVWDIQMCFGFANFYKRFI